MATNYTIRGGHEAVTVITRNDGVEIEYGHEGIMATIKLDYGEARELAQAIFEGAELWLGEDGS